MRSVKNFIPKIFEFLGYLVGRSVYAKGRAIEITGEKTLLVKSEVRDALNVGRVHLSEMNNKYQEGRRRALSDADEDFVDHENENED